MLVKLNEGNENLDLEKLASSNKNAELLLKLLNASYILLTLIYKNN